MRKADQKWERDMMKKNVENAQEAGYAYSCEMQEVSNNGLGVIVQENQWPPICPTRRYSYMRPKTL